MKLKEIKASLEVGFPQEGPPLRFLSLRGKEWRAIPSSEEFPFEDSQFDVVTMDGSVVSRRSVREAHRVLKPDGELHFSVPVKRGSDEGFTLPDIYAIVRSGFNITGLERPKWWHFGFGERAFTVCARKKSWRATTGTFRPLA